MVIPDDWIGIYSPRQTPGANTPSTRWLYTNGTQSPSGSKTSGTVAFGNPGLSAGTYDVYFLLNNDYTQIAGPVKLTVLTGEPVYLKISDTNLYLHASGGSNVGAAETLHSCPKANDHPNCRWKLEPGSSNL